jgi:hypothetical protein
MRPTRMLIIATLLGLAAGPAAADETPPLSVYGFARLDFIVDDSPLSDAEAPYFVASEPGGGTNAEMSMHPRLSRVGLSIDEWRIDSGIDGEGALEVDFQNGGADGSALMRLRHAYVSLRFVDHIEILTGQTWDLMSPLFPSANNDSLMGNAGNTGDRRPQIRVTVVPTSRLRVGLAVSATGAIDAQDADGDGRMDGRESGVPMFQGLIEHRVRMFDSVGRFGMWMHAGREELADGTALGTWSVGGHLMVPIGKSFTLLGEVFHGKNLDDVRGGIGQGVNTDMMQEITSTGGWIEGAFIAGRKHMVAAGNTMDFPRERDLSDGARESNITGYGVYRYRPHESVQLGAEYVRWFTGYKNAPDGRANRVNLHMTVFF